MKKLIIALCATLILSLGVAVMSHYVETRYTAPAHLVSEEELPFIRTTT